MPDEELKPPKALSDLSPDELEICHGFYGNAFGREIFRPGLRWRIMDLQAQLEIHPKRRSADALAGCALSDADIRAELRLARMWCHVLPANVAKWYQESVEAAQTPDEQQDIRALAGRGTDAFYSEVSENGIEDEWA